MDLGAIEQNTLQVRKSLPKPVELMAVVKADAYGHGALMVLPVLEASGVSMIGVAAMDEALQARRAGLTIPILVLGVTPDWAMHYAMENDIQIAIFSQLHLDSLERLYEVTGIPARVHIKVDTGMHRIGVPWEQGAAFVKHCQDQPFLDVVGLFSHFAHTDDRDFTALQIHRWNEVLGALSSLPPLRHIANSSGVWHYPLEETTNMVRVGISLFGYPGDSLPLPVELQCAMGLKARIVHLQDLKPGEGVSYSRTFRNETTESRTIATLPLGYADGIPRNLSNRIEGLYRGRRIPQVGNITMDQLMMDLTGIPDAAVGDVVVLIGGSGRPGESTITLADWAEKLGTIEYELMCNLRVRLPKTYVR